MKKYRCLVCDFIYDPAVGDPDSGIAPGTLFEHLPDSWACDGTTLESFRKTSWIKVQDPVRKARVRYTVDGVPGPWFTAARHGRFIHLQSWAGPGAAATGQLQLLDRNGSPVHVRGVSGPVHVGGCSGSDVAIG